MITVYSWTLYREIIELWNTRRSKFPMYIKYSKIKDKENCCLIVLYCNLEKHIVYRGGIDRLKLLWVLNKYNLPWSTEKYKIYYFYNNMPIMCDV